MIIPTDDSKIVLGDIDPSAIRYDRLGDTHHAAILCVLSDILVLYKQKGSAILLDDAYLERAAASLDGRFSKRIKDSLPERFKRSGLLVPVGGDETGYTIDPDKAFTYITSMRETNRLGLNMDLMDISGTFREGDYRRAEIKIYGILIGVDELARRLEEVYRSTQEGERPAYPEVNHKFDLVSNGERIRYTISFRNGVNGRSELANIEGELRSTDSFTIRFREDNQVILNTINRLRKSAELSYSSPRE